MLQAAQFNDSKLRSSWSSDNSEQSPISPDLPHDYMPPKNEKAFAQNFIIRRQQT